jgi:transcriptional regulator with XRE-family HTH domain
MPPRTGTRLVNSAPRGKRSESSASLEANVGEAVRRLRVASKLSVRTLAARSRFSPSFISQIELEQASPSLSSLDRLATALGVTLGEFFGSHNTAASAVTKANRRRRLTSWWSRARIEALSPMNAGRRFESLIVTLSPGGASGKRPHSQTGEDFGLVLRGTVRLTLGDAVHELAVGDAVTFNAATPHLWENAGRQKASLLIVSSRLKPQ